MNSRWFLCFVAVWILALGLPACQSTSSSTPSVAGTFGTQPVPIIAHLTGNDPALKYPSVLLINSQAELARLGAQELSRHPVDFNQHSLVVLALGEKPTGGYWARITAIQKSGTDLFVQGIANRPAKDQPVTQALSYPYAAAIVPKTLAKRIYSEIESVQGR